MKINFAPLVLLALFITATASYAQTTSLTILNPSFELQSSTASSFYSTYPSPYGITDWTDPVNVSGGTTFITASIYLFKDIQAPLREPMPSNSIMLKRQEAPISTRH